MLKVASERSDALDALEMYLDLEESQRSDWRTGHTTRRDCHGITTADHGSRNRE